MLIMYIIGAAGFVVNEKHEVLLIQEKHQASGSAIWKYPEGVADLGDRRYCQYCVWQPLVIDLCVDYRGTPEPNSFQGDL